MPRWPPDHPRIDIVCDPDGAHLAEPERDEVGVALGCPRLPLAAQAVQDWAATLAD